MKSSWKFVVSAGILAAGVAAVALLAPGGLGDARPEVVTGGASARAYRSVVDAGAGAPGWLRGLGEHLALAALAVLAALLAAFGLRQWRRGRALGATVLLAAGAVPAYLMSEAVKLVVDQERPCRAFAGLATWAPCPPPGDWSFPSNHATLAGALAAAVVVLAPRFALLAVPAAGVVAVARVLTGVHYPHDVLAGLLLGASVTLALWALPLPAAARLGGALRQRSAAGRSGPGR